MAIAAHNYANDQNDYYPIAYLNMDVSTPGKVVHRYWDFIVTKDWSSDSFTVKPGFLWQGKTIAKIQQCPSFDGSANSPGDPYTGYNYNTSYIGGQIGFVPELGSNGFIPPAKVTDVRRPDQCAMFGDGQYGAGANKFMRAPWPGLRDPHFFGRAAGTQGFRHLDRTNVGWCDGHADSRKDVYKETDPAERDNVADGTGFLSPDNRLYALDPDAIDPNDRP
jgi:prepilin-type processing-associated H-X9-DG protein